MFRPKVILVAILALLMIILVVQNSEVVTVTLLFCSIPAASTSYLGQRVSRSAGRSRDRRNRASLEALGGGEIAMHLVVVMMLGICVPSIATGFTEVDYVAEAVRAGTVSSQTQAGAEAEAADAASKGASPPPAPAKATGELTDGERLFQGVWQLNNYGSDTRTGKVAYRRPRLSKAWCRSTEGAESDAGGDDSSRSSHRRQRSEDEA